MSCASWALRFAASLDGILAVLSGMSNLAQMQDNLATFTEFGPVTDAERDAVARAQKILAHSAAIPCTGCGYCGGGLPPADLHPQDFRCRPTSSWPGMNRNRPKRPMPGPLRDGAKPPTASAAASARGPAPSTCR